MICFLPPPPPMRPEPDPVPPRTARAAEAVILIFVVLNVLLVLTGLLPLLLRMETRSASVASSEACSSPASEPRRCLTAPPSPRTHDASR